jgi:hypothetical protein
MLMGRSGGAGGTGGGGGGSSGSDSSSTEDGEQRSVGDYGGTEEEEEREDEDDDGGSGVATGAAVLGGSTAAAGGAGAGAVGGGVAGGGAGGSQSETDDDTQEEEEEEEEEAQSDPRTDLDPPSEDQSDTGEREREPEWEHEPEEETESEEEEQDGEKEGEETEDKEDETEDEEDEEQPEAKVTVRTDPWDNVGWGLRPVIRKIKERYGDQVEVEYEMVSVRSFGDPEHFREKWKRDSDRHGMPIDTSVWGEDSPESTEKSNKAFRIAKELSSDTCEEYLHTLWLNSVVGGHSIETEEVLGELASEVGYDLEDFRELWDEMEPNEGKIDGLPVTTIETNEGSFQRTGYFDFEDVETVFFRFEENPLPSVEECVEKYHPIAVKEIEILCEVSHEEAINELRESEATEEVEVGRNTLWTVRE